MMKINKYSGVNKNIALFVTVYSYSILYCLQILYTLLSTDTLYVTVYSYSNRERAMYRVPVDSNV
jgi:hypothetical protein